MSAKAKIGAQIRVHAQSCHSKSRQFVIGRKSSENQQNRGQKSPRNREYQRKREHIRSELDYKPPSQFRVLTKNANQLLKEVRQHQDNAEYHSCRDNGKQNLLPDVAVENFEIEHESGRLAGTLLRLAVLANV